MRLEKGAGRSIEVENLQDAIAALIGRFESPPPYERGPCMLRVRQWVTGYTYDVISKTLAVRSLHADGI